MRESRLAAWLSLSLAPGFSPRQLQTFLSYCSCPERLLQHSWPEDTPGKALRSLRQAAQSKAVQEQVTAALKWQQQADCHILTLDSAEYPELLKTIPDPPPVLYVKGEPARLKQSQIALVGSRKPSPGGREIARQMAQDLSQNSFTITSGLALGIDTESHYGALAAGGSSIAVLGCGLEQVYPRSNCVLAEKLQVAGAVIAEFPLSAAPLAWHFPMRNRIISGLSQAVVVIEATQKSGSLITAQCALDQGRDVFAVPGSPCNPVSAGCNALIKSGAGVAENAADILAELGIFAAESTASIRQEPPTPHTLSQAATRLLAQMDMNPASIDRLIQRSELRPEKLLAILAELEILGLVQAVPGGYSLSPVRA